MTPERLQSRVELLTESGCWIWLGATNKAGYGNVYHDKRWINAHRVSYMLFRGPIPPGLHVCHRCDIPQCVNPGHLFVGTGADNHLDKCAKGRAKGAPGSRHPLAKLTDEQVGEIRTSPERNSFFCRKYGLSRGTVSGIRLKRYWKHLP